MELELSGRLGALLGAELEWLSWLLTYSFHAAFWAGAVAVLVRVPLPSALRHAAWKVALFGPLLTTLIAHAPRFDGVHAVTAHMPELAIVSLRSAKPPALSHSIFGSLLLAGALVGLVRQSVAALSLGRRLARRRRVRDARLLECCARLRARLGLRAVTLSESAAIDGPLVLGIGEICVPHSMSSELGAAEVEAVLAHELAHLERHDGIWFPLVGLLHAALWWHPVTRWVCARVRQSAESACDDRCVQLTGEPRALARALTQIAARALVIDPALGLPTMAHPRSSLVARVAHLTSGVRPVERGSRRSRLGLVLGLASVAALSVGSSVRVAVARPATARTAATLGRNTSDLSRQMNALAQRQQLLELELQDLSVRSAGPSDSVRAIEAEQELRHVREMQIWIEAGLESP